MKYEFKDSDEMYLKVYPYTFGWNSPTRRDLDDIERSINRHVDDVGCIENIVEQLYVYNDGEYEYESKTFYGLCKEIAINRQLIEDSYWKISWVSNNEKYSATIYEFENLLDYVVEYNCEILSGNLTKEQCILVDIARELYGDVDYE